MPSEPRWLTVEHAAEFNRLAVAATGEPFALRVPGFLESAMAVPVNRWRYGEQDVPTLAAGLLLAIARNHPFLQGNKRVELLVADAFLSVNGWRLLYPDQHLADLILSATERAVEEQEFIKRFRAGCGRRQPAGAAMTTAERQAAGSALGRRKRIPTEIMRTVSASMISPS